MPSKPFTRSSLRPVMAAAVALLWTSFAALAVHAQDQGAQDQGTRLLRHPAVSTDHIAFSYGQDLWIVDRLGGEARRLTSFQGREVRPAFSPDGLTVAFSGEYDGNVDVYTVPISGGEPVRLTFHPGVDSVRGFSNDGKRVLFTSGRDTAPVSYLRYWGIDVQGGMPAPLPFPRAFKGGYNATGSHFAYQEVSPNDIEWRGYRGGQAKPIWIVGATDFDLETTPWEGSMDTDPVYVGDELYFLSDRDWAVNLYRYRAGQLEQVTTERDFDIKNLSAGGGVLVYEMGGYIYLYDPQKGSAQQVNITLRGDLPWRRPHWEDVGESLSNAALSPTGKRAVFEARGEILTVPAEKGDDRNLTRSSGIADREPAWSPDGKHIAWFSDKDGAYSLVLGEPTGLEGVRTIELEAASFYYDLAWSPDSEHVLFTDEGQSLLVMEVESGQVIQVDTDDYAHPQRTIDPVWSPDSRWIAYSKRLDSQYHVVMIYDTENATRHQITDGLSDATSPQWDRGGKYLYLLASTNLALTTGWLDMSSYANRPTQSVYLAVLAKDGEPPFPLRSDDEEIEDDRDSDEDSSESGESDDEVGKKGKKSKKTAKGDSKDEAEGDSEEAKDDELKVSIDFEGLERRIVALEGVSEGSYLGLEAGPEGVVFIAEQTPPASPVLDLKRYSLEDREAKSFLSGIQGATVSADGKKLLYRASSTWGIVDTSGSAEVGDGKLGTDLRVKVDPRAEWRQMFDEAWRLQRDFLYVENLHGADWDEVYRKYSPWVEHVAHRADLNHLIDIMTGEVAIGHSFVAGGDQPDVDRVAVGLLGADWSVDQGRYQIGKIYTGESWNPQLRAPLSGPGIDVKKGDYLIRVGGQEITTETNLFSAFEGTAGRQTTLHLSVKPDGSDLRAVTVVPVPSEGGLRRYDWVEGNRRRVDELSDGKLAYVWLPDTAAGGYAAFNRYYFAQQDRKGAVIDERFNGGGSAADYIVDIMARTLQGYFNSPVGSRRPWTNPQAGLWGPKVMIINETAGSGGDLMPWMFRNKNVGPLVGTRTWGGLVGIWGTPSLIDGGFVTAPRGGFFDNEGRWAVENEGVAPDIEVEQTPADVIAGKDPQLEAAVAEALRLLEENPVELLAEPPPPVRARRP